MNKQPCQLAIYTHEFDEEGNELDGLHYISYNKRIFVPYEINGFKKKNTHKKTKSLNLGGNNAKNLDKNLKKESSKNNITEVRKSLEKPLKKNNSQKKVKIPKKTINKKNNNSALKTEKEKEPFIQTDSNIINSINNNKYLTSSFGFGKSFSNVSNVNNSFSIKKSFNRTGSSKSPINKMKVIPKKEQIISSSISDIIQIKEKINKLIEEESELETQKNDIISHFEFRLQPMRELNQQLIIDNKEIIEKEELLQKELNELKNKHNILFNQFNEKGILINNLNTNYENEKNNFEKKQKEDIENLENYFKNTWEKIENGNVVSLDLP
jgi:hypothetical protein